MLLFLWRLLSRVLGSLMQLELQGLPVLSAPIAFWTVWYDLAAGQPGWFLCLTRYCLSLHVPAGPPPEVSLIPLLLLAGVCGLHSVKQDGDAPGGSALIVCCSSASVTLATYLPSQLYWCSVGLVTLVTWIFAIWLLKPRESTCRKMVVMQ